MPKDSPGTVRLQVEVLEARSLLSATTPLPSPGYGPAVQTADQGSPTSPGTPAPTAPTISSPPQVLSQGQETAGQDGKTSAGPQQLAQPAPDPDASRDDEYRPAPAGSPNWAVYVSAEEIREAGAAARTGRDDHDLPAATQPASVSYLTQPAAGAAVTLVPSLAAAADHAAPIAFVLGLKASSPSDEPERLAQGSTLSVRTEETALGEHRSRLDRIPGAVDFQAAATAHGFGMTAAVAPVLVETRSAPIAFVAAVGESWWVSNWNGAVASLVDDLRGFAVGRPGGLLGSLSRLDLIPQAGGAASFPEGGDVSALALAPPGLLLDALAADAGQLQAGVRGFLQQLNHLGTDLATTPSGVVVSCWLLAVTAAGSACEIVRRQSKRRRGRRWTGDPLFTWLPEAAEEP
jgi:hypothetical protein